MFVGAWEGAVVAGGAELWAAVDSVKGSGPGRAAAWRKTSPTLFFLPESPPERVRSRATAVTATTAVVARAIRGADLHQGDDRGPSGGGPEAGWEGPERGPEGGPVGPPEDGGSILTHPPEVGFVLLPNIPIVCSTWVTPASRQDVPRELTPTAHPAGVPGPACLAWQA